MSPRRHGRRSRRLLRLGGLALLLAGLGLACWFVYDQVRAWRHLDAARDALERGESRLARRHLQVCLRSWPRSGEVHFLAARAARRCGELEEASEHLDRAAEYGWVSTAIDLERALWRVQTRDLASVEPYLLRCLELRHPDSLLIVEILAPAYLQNYQLEQARQWIERWLELAPTAAAAWHARGILAERRQGRNLALDSYQEAVRLDPGRRDSRLGLARSLLNANRPAEARLQLEELLRQDPEDAEAQVKLAGCLKALGKTDEASRVLDTLLQKRPDDAEALHLKGKLELDLGNPRGAAAHLRRAVTKAPFDRELLYTWQRCLRQVGSPLEVEECQKRLARVEADLRLLAELTGKIPSDPHNPDLRCKAGEVMLRNGQDQEGLRWLQSALAIRADHAPTHKALADYYERNGDAAQAAQHRNLAGP